MTTAEITKTYDDGTVEILTLPVESARAHVKARTDNPASFGLAGIAVRVGGKTLRWSEAAGWAKECGNAEAEHPGFPCAHPARTAA